MILFGILSIPFMALMSALTGGSLESKIPSKITSALFALPIAIAFDMVVGIWWLSLLIFIWSWAIKETGHKDALDMGEGSPLPDRDNKLTPVIIWISDKFGRKRESAFFDITFWMVKAFLITLPIGGTGVFFMPALRYMAKEIAPYKLQGVAREATYGAGAGLSILLFLAVM